MFTYIWLIFMVNVGKYTSPMDCMGIERSIVCVYPNHSDLTRPGPPNGRVVGEPPNKWPYIRKI